MRAHDTCQACDVADAKGEQAPRHEKGGEWSEKGGGGKGRDAVEALCATPARPGEAGGYEFGAEAGRGRSG